MQDGAVILDDATVNTKKRSLKNLFFELISIKFTKITKSKPFCSKGYQKIARISGDFLASIYIFLN